MTFYLLLRQVQSRSCFIFLRSSNAVSLLAERERACLDSHWTNRRSPESVQMLLDAGASVNGVAFPGYREVDELLQPHVATL